jgi:hypothetical protein
MQPNGVHGRKPANPVMSSPALSTEKPSTSFVGEIRSIT